MPVTPPHQPHPHEEAMSSAPKQNVAMDKGKGQMLPNNSNDPLASFSGLNLKDHGVTHTPRHWRNRRRDKQQRRLRMAPPPKANKVVDQIEEFEEEFDDQPYEPPIVDFFQEREEEDEMLRGYLSCDARTTTTNNNQYTNRCDVKIKLKSFNGENNPKKYLLDWEQTTYFILNNLGYEKHEKLEVVTLHYTGQGRNWWFILVVDRRQKGF